jgi:putative aminopeptidase FrvX
VPPQSLRPGRGALLDEVLPTHSPAGRKEELDEIILRRLTPYGQAASRDHQGNIVLQLAGREPGPQ